MLKESVGAILITGGTGSSAPTSSELIPHECIEQNRHGRSAYAFRSLIWRLHCCVHERLSRAAIAALRKEATVRELSSVVSLTEIAVTQIEERSRSTRGT